MRFFVSGTNYCGPGGNGNTTSGVDEACRIHDLAYGESGYSSYIKNQDADEMFLSNLSKVRPFGTKQRLTKWFATRYFRAKVNAWNMVKYRRGITGKKVQTKVPEYYPYKNKGKRRPVLRLRKRVGLVRGSGGLFPRSNLAMRNGGRPQRFFNQNRFRRAIYKKRIWR